MSDRHLDFSKKPKKKKNNENKIVFKSPRKKNEKLLLDMSLRILCKQLDFYNIFARLFCR